MIAQNTMKVNGKWFYAGDEIAEVEKSTSDFSQYMNPPEEPKAYSKTEINRMSTAELKELAKEQNVDNSESMTGADLKKALIEKFGL